jgi:hypothetical protein
MSGANSEYIFNYLDDIWDTLPEIDRLRFSETWKAYEQTYGDVWTKLIERQMGVNIDYLPLYNNRRWFNHIFDSTTQINRQAMYRSPQDMSLGLNLQNRYLINVQINQDPAVEIDLRGLNPGTTTLTEMVNNINTALLKVVAYSVQSGQLLEFKSDIAGPLSSISFLSVSDPSKDASEIVLGLDPLVDIPVTYPKYPYEFLLGDKLIVSIPKLQDKISEESATTPILIQNVDYEIEFGTGIISFLNLPPELMWAPNTLFNQETPYNNYGYLMDIYDDNKESYLKAVKGLWYAFWTGPRPENIRRSLYLLFGLPVSSQAGAVTNVTATQIFISYKDGTSEIFEIPSGLTSLVRVGQEVTKFEPLVSGIKVFDKVNYPGFLEAETGRAGVQKFLTQHATRGSDPSTDESKALKMVEQNSYLPQIDVSTFISPDIKLGNVKTFLSNLQPKSRTFLFQILVGVFRDQIIVKDEGVRSQTDPDFPNGIPALQFDISFDATPNVDYNVNTFAQQSDLDEAEANDYTYMMLDEGMASGDRVEIDVYQSITLIDSFTLEG